MDRDKKILNAFNLQAEKNLSNIEVAKAYAVNPATITKWKKRLKEIDYDLYQVISCINYLNSGKRKQEVTNYYVNIIAHLIISYKLTLNQAITLSGYNISSGKLSTHLSKDLDRNLYSEVKKVLDEFNGSKTTKEQREYFEQLLEKKKRDDEAFYELPHARDILNVADDILSGKNISKVAKNYNCTRNELIDHIMELLPNIDYNKYLQVLIKLRLFNLEKQYYNDAKTYTYEQEPITNFRR